jgi:signal transduction histidine kinase
LDTARDKADHKMGMADSGLHVRDVVARDRAIEDATLRDERAAADESLRLQREDDYRALAALLPLEREETDRDLLTERARSDDAIANRDDFLGMVSHDLRNLLSGIVLHASLLSGKASDSDEGRRTVDGMQRIQGYVARMNRLIGDLVDIVSIDAGKLAIHHKPYNASALLAEAVDMFAHAASQKGISLECEAGQRVLMADFDHERILQVLANLITNGLKFTPRGGRIAVRVERAGDEVRLSVIDTGEGIPSNMLETVFERFRQVARNDRKGLGLGLYISRCIVDAHGGRIWAESKPGEGTTLHFTIPIAAPRQAGSD